MDHTQLAIYPFLSIPQTCSKRFLSAGHSAEHEKIKKGGKLGSIHSFFILHSTFVWVYMTHQELTVGRLYMKDRK